MPPDGIVGVVAETFLRDRVRRGSVAMAVTVTPPIGTLDEDFHWLTAEEERSLFDTQAWEIAGVSGEEFLRRLDAGEFRDVLDDPDRGDIMYLALLSRIVR